MIRYFLILKRSGENIYKNCFGNVDIDENVVSGFFSAFFTFTQTLFSADVQDIELGPYSMLFEIVEKEIILVAIYDKADSLINVQQKLTDLKNVISLEYGRKIKQNVCDTDDFKGINRIVEKIILEEKKVQLDEKSKAQYTQLLGDFRSNNEIEDCSLISITGIPLIYETKREFLDLIIKQMDAFWKFKSEVLDQIILSYENRYIILVKINENLVLSALIRRNTPIGLATMLIEEYATKIANIADSRIF